MRSNPLATRSRRSIGHPSMPPSWMVAPPSSGEYDPRINNTATAQGGARMDELLRTTADRALHYLAGLNGRSVAPTPDAVARLAELDGPLPDGPGDPAETIALLNTYGSPA